MGYYEFPHTRNYDTDLGYLIKRYFELNTDFESLEKNFNDLKAWCIAQLNSEALKTLVANKLDEWLQDGTLAGLINNALLHVTTYDTVVEMITHTGLENGSKIYCTGADSVNDGKGGHFRIRPRLSTDIIDYYNLYLIDGGIKVAERIGSQLSTRRIILMADSYGDYDSPFTNQHYSWTEYCKQRLDNIYGSDNVFNISMGSRGFVYNPSVGTFLDGLQQANIYDKNSITDIYVCGGTNDVVGMTIANITEAQIIEAIGNFINYCKNAYPNAVVHIGFNGNYYNSRVNVEKVINCYKKCTDYGGSYMINLDCILKCINLIDISGIHPTPKGFELLNYYTYQYIINNAFDFNYNFSVLSDYELVENVNNIIIAPISLKQNNDLLMFELFANGNKITFKDTKPLITESYSIPVLKYNDYGFPIQSGDYELGLQQCLVEFDNNQTVIMWLLVHVSNRELTFNFIPNLYIINNNVDFSINRINSITLYLASFIK